MFSRTTTMAQHMQLPRSMPIRARATQLSSHVTSPLRRSTTTLAGAAATPAAATPAASNVVFPHNDTISVDGREVNYRQIIDMLAPAVTPERLEKMQQVIASRSYGVLPVVEGLYDMGNLAAVCRSADAMGFGAVHCIMRPSDKYKKSQRTAAGADKWLDTRLWDSTADCLGSLKAAGYQIVTTHLSASSVTVQEVNFTRPTAFVLGNERAGVSETAVAMADHTAIIPMAGFVESFNISVAAALILYEAQQQRLRRLGRPGDLTEQQQERLMAEFLLRSVKHSKLMVGQLLDRPPPPHQKRFFRANDSSSPAASEATPAAEAADRDAQEAAVAGQQVATAAGTSAAQQAPKLGKESLQQQQQDTAASAA